MAHVQHKAPVNHVHFHTQHDWVRGFFITPTYTDADGVQFPLFTAITLSALTLALFLPSFFKALFCILYFLRQAEVERRQKLPGPIPLYHMYNYYFYAS